MEHSTKKNCEIIYKNTFSTDMSKIDKLKVVKIIRQYFASNDNLYCGISKPVECQLLTRLPCWLTFHIWMLYTASTQPVLCPRLAYLLCRYFANNDSQYCSSSKPVESQLALRFLWQQQTSKVQTVDDNSMSVYSQYFDVVYSQHSTSTAPKDGILLCRYFASNDNQY